MTRSLESFLPGRSVHKDHSSEMVLKSYPGSELTDPASHTAARCGAFLLFIH